KAIITIYNGCWFNAYDTAYTSDTFLISENAGMVVTDVTGSGGVPVDPNHLDFLGNGASANRISNIFNQTGAFAT
ncbi:unnamed protein product, partial [marine sediment metagenome]